MEKGATTDTTSMLKLYKLQQGKGREKDKRQKEGEKRETRQKTTEMVKLGKMKEGKESTRKIIKKGDRERQNRGNVDAKTRKAYKRGRTQRGKEEKQEGNKTDRMYMIKTQ